MEKSRTLKIVEAILGLVLILMLVTTSMLINDMSREMDRIKVTVEQSNQMLKDMTE